MPVGFLYRTTEPSKTLTLRRELMHRSGRTEPLSCPCRGTDMMGCKMIGCVVKCMSDVWDLPSPLWWQISYWGSVSCWLTDWLRSTGKYHLAAKWVIPIAQDAVINGVKGRRGFSCDGVDPCGCSRADLSQIELKPCFYWLPCWVGISYYIEETCYGQAQVYKWFGLASLPANRYEGCTITSHNYYNKSVLVCGSLPMRSSLARCVRVVLDHPGWMCTHTLSACWATNTSLRTKSGQSRAFEMKSSGAVCISPKPMEAGRKITFVLPLFGHNSLWCTNGLLKKKKGQNRR